MYIIVILINPLRTFLLQLVRNRCTEHRAVHSSQEEDQKPISKTLGRNKAEKNGIEEELPLL